MGSNSIARVHHTLSRASTQHPNDPAWKAWAHAFELPTVFKEGSLTHSLLHEVASCVSLTYQQLRQGRAQIDRTPFKRETFDPIFDNAEKVLSIGSLEGPWNLSRQHLGSEVLPMLKAYSEALPDDDETTADEIAQLVKQCRQLEELITKHKLPDDLKLFLLRQLDIIQQAIREFRIRGGEAFRDAAYNMAVDAAENQEIVQQHAKLEPVTVWRQIAFAVAKYGKWTIMLGKFLKAGQDIVEIVSGTYNSLPPGAKL